MSHSRGGGFDVLAPRSKFYQGPFGRLCPDLPAWTPPEINNPEALDQFLLNFANSHMVERLDGNGTIVPPADLTAPNIVGELETEFGTGDVNDTSTGIPAGYTYFGQFVDHDVTFDPASSLMRQNDPNGLLNFRTPRLDLDNVYGRGPSEQPYLYDGSTGKMLIGQVAGSSLRDLPRNTQGRALIGDMRNDENSMVSQLQLAFLLAHNTLVDRATAQGMDASAAFKAAQKTLRWLYQWIVWNDFAKRISDPTVHGCALTLEDRCGGRRGWHGGLSDVYKWRDQPFMPVEFSVAAYRFGHSMVRNGYQTNAPHRGFQVFAPIFDNTPGTSGNDLRGFRPMTNDNTIQWDWFLKMTTSGGPFPQRARKIDTKLANALSFLHEGPTGSADNVLAFRNLKRGITFGLPSGTDMARKYCLEPVPLSNDEPDSLWFYTLKEAEAQQSGERLGQLGSTIVCATFAGLLLGDPSSYITQSPCWTPNTDPLLCPGLDNVDTDAPDTWDLAAIIRLAGLPVDANDVSEQTNGNIPEVPGCP